MFKCLNKTKQPLLELSVRSRQTIIPGPILTIENIHGTYYNPTNNLQSVLYITYITELYKVYKANIKLMYNIM